MKQGPVNTPEYIILNLDGSGKIEQWNESAVRFFGFNKEQILLKSFGRLVENNLERSDNTEKLLHQAIIESGLKRKIKLKTKVGNCYDAKLSLDPICNGNEVLGFTALISDIEHTTKNNVRNQQLKTDKEEEEYIKQLETKVATLTQNLNAIATAISHDLKAPLRAMAGYMRVINEEYSSEISEEERNILDFINSNLKKCTTLAEQLVSFTRVCSRELNFSEVDMEELLFCVVEEYNRSNPNKSKIVMENMPKIKGDFSLLHVLFAELISNATKFSSFKLQSEISIKCSENDNCFVFCVEDNGIGLDMKFARNIFVNVGRYHSFKDLPGVGMGLIIVAKIAERHLGKVWVESELEKYTKVFISLPKDSN